ncbi:MAG TPA: hypothetical protein VNH39_01195 [Steroidobacteraceae bacterium]|nr:hypothetical protein [Steroidobacteraceae bacterium]
MLPCAVKAVLSLDEPEIDELPDLLIDGLPGEPAIGCNVPLGRPALAFIVGMIGELEQHQLG